jgi:hypothetical protein
MASKSSALGALLYEDETNFGEDTDTTSIRLRPIGMVDFQPSFPSQEVDILRQYPHEGVAPTRMPMGGSFSFTQNLTGLGATAASTAPASALVTLLGKVFGQTTTGLSTGTTASAGTSSITTAAASGITRGGPVHIGAKGDGRGDGQWVVGTTHTSNTYTSLVALPAAASGTDTVFCSRVIYESSTPGTYETITSARFRFQSAQQQYLAHGCYPTAAEFSLSPGAVPTVRLTYAIAWWELDNETFPDATAVQDYGAAPIAGGSLFMNAVGTATRVTYPARSVSFSVALNNMGEPGVGGYDEHQLIQGCSRGPSKALFEITLDSLAAGTNTYGDLFDTSENARVNRHVMYSMSVVDGRALCLYLPNLALTEHPIQTDDGGLLRQPLRFRADRGTDTTSDLSSSPWRIAFA